MVYLLETTASVRNDGRRLALLDAQSQIFFGFVRLPETARMRTSIIGRQIFLPYLDKARSTSIETTVVASSYPTRAKAMTFLTEDLFPIDACAYITWMYPVVDILVSTTRFGKYVQTGLNFDPSGLSERIAS